MAQLKVSTLIKKIATGLTAGLATIGILEVAVSAPAQEPLFLTQPVRPIMMLNMSLDHQLFFKLYDDYSDLDGDGAPDTTYMHLDHEDEAYHYYGYFDSAKCYTYDTTDLRFEPSRFADDNNYCNYGDVRNEWSGNFLNWATMTRMDAVRKILYGGMRSTDLEAETVLERAFLPQDAHAFAKYYVGTDVSKLTPFNSNSGASEAKQRGITICNTTDPGTSRAVLSQNVTAAPKMQVAQGNFSLWASNERWQCRWGVNSNFNDASKSGINAHESSPTKNDNGLGEKDYIVRVQACVNSLISDDDHPDNNENCRGYGDNYKPSGLLQTYGENDAIHFGLMTGSYGKNKSGGVLRKNIGSFTTEVAANGTFDIGDEDSIVGALNSVRIYGYDYGGGTYHESDGADDDCSWALSSFTNGKCSNWGNPQSEIFLESLRYLAGTKSPNFSVDDSGRIGGLRTATWDDPITNDNYCAPASIIQFNASTSSYDGDDLDGASSLGEGFNVGAWTDLVGAGEGIHGNKYFIGKSGDSNDELCTPKTVNSLAGAKGTCPDAPRLEGSYQIAGLAYYARSQGLSNNGTQKVRTYGVALAPAVPRVTIPVSGGKKVTILPACRNKHLDPDANCAIVDFKIVEQDDDSGKLYVNWEDSEQGGDYDQDMWGVIDYSISGNTITVTTEVIAQSTGDDMGFGYVISGTSDDGFHVQSGVNNFLYGNSCTSTEGFKCTCLSSETEGKCDIATARSKEFIIGSSDAELLEQPLYYAAKWGGFDVSNGATSPNVDEDPETYFYATDPRALEASLNAAFASVAESIGSASAVSTNSTRLEEGSLLYQARFNSKDWSGELLAYAFDQYGNIEGEPVSTNDTLNTNTINSSTRRMYTYNGSNTVWFEWNNLTGTQQTLLGEGDAALGAKRVSWLRGASVDGLRVREKPAGGGGERLLGDIVNSSPAYLGGRDLRYDRLPGEAGASYRAYVAKKREEMTPRVFVGANDGMLHAFDADTLEEDFAYIPNGVFAKLADITKPSYGRNGSGNGHEYLVDGPVTVGDAYLTVSGEKKWRSIVVGTFGAGGRGLYALDVTDDTPRVLFELDDMGGHIGYITGHPYIVPLKNSSGIRWAVVFGNGYEANSSRLYYIDLESKAVGYMTVNDGEGSGLSTPALLPNGHGIIEAAYAGDLDGNMWKFDLYNTDPTTWSSKKLFAAGAGQAITSAPALGVNSARDHYVMVYFGTGKYLYTGDNNTSIGTQTVYAIIDDPANGTLTPDGLHEKTINVLDGGGRSVTGHTINWATAEGWRMDLPTAGERVITKPILLHDKLIFTTIIPSAIACQYGGSSWIIEVPAVGNKYVNQTIIGDPIYNDSLIMGEMGLGLVSPPPEDDSDENDGEDGGGDGGGCGAGELPAKVYALSSKGQLLSEDGCLAAGTLGRTSWRQIR